MTDLTAPVRPRSAVAPRWMITAMVLLAAAIVLSGQAWADSPQPTQAVVWGSVGLAAYAASLLCLVGGGRGAVLGLSRWLFGSWTLVWYGVACGLASLTWVEPQTGTPAEISPSSVLRALWLVAVGMTLWALGYFTGPGRPAERLGQRAMAALSLRFAPEVRSPLAPWILYALGSAARIATAVTTGRFGYVGNVQSTFTTASSYEQWLGVLGQCAPLAVVAAALQVYRERVPGARVTLAVLFAAEIAVGAATGNKESYIVAVLAVAVPFTVARRRLHRGLLVFAVAAFLLVIVPFNQAYRNAARSATGTLSASQAISEVPGILRQTVTTGNAGGVLSSSTSFMLARIREIDSPAIIMQRTPSQIGFLSPVQLIEGPVVTLVPRAVWPGKPILDTGYEVSQQYYELPSTVYTSSAITPVADLYRHGGWIPVIVGMFLFGCGVRFLDNVLDVSRNPHAIFLFVLLFPSLVNQEDDWIGTLAGIPGTLLVWLFAVFLTFRRRRRAGALAALPPRPLPRSLPRCAPG
jgi:hypothetical protein